MAPENIDTSKKKKIGSPDGKHQTINGLMNGDVSKVIQNPKTKTNS